jgi:hypothetical protein
MKPLLLTAIFLLLLLNVLLPACAPTPPPPSPSAGSPTSASSGDAKPPTAAPDDAHPIAYNEIGEGELDAQTPLQRWRFSGQAGEQVNIVLNSPFDSYLELYGPDGDLLAYNDDVANSLNAALLNVILRQNGSYVIVTRGYAGAVGSYALTLTGGHPTVGSGPLKSGALFLTAQGTKWRYVGRQGSYLTLGVQAEPSVDSHLTLYGPDGAILLADDDSGEGRNAEIYEYQLPADGTYTILARSLSGPGPATLTFTATEHASGGGPLTAGEPLTATLRAGRRHKWSFAGQQGQSVTLTMAATEFVPSLELRSSHNMILAETNSRDNPAAIAAYPLPADGTYYVIARAADDQSGGTYELSLALATEPAPASGGTLTPDTPVEGVLTPPQTNTWLFEAAAGQFVTIEVQSELLDSYLELYGPDDTLLVESDGGGGKLNAALLEFPLTTSGEYRLEVRSARRDMAGGSYRLTLTLADELQPTGEVLLNGDTVRGQLAPGEYHLWQFEANRETHILLTAQSTALKLSLALYDRDGQLLAQNDDFSDSEVAINDFVLPWYDDQYRVVVRADSPAAAGDYTLSLEEIVQLTGQPSQR